MTNQQLLHGAGLDAVIGMYPVIHRLRTTVVTPVVAGALGDPLVRAPQSVLLYGPPQCGTSFIAVQLASELEALAEHRVVVLARIDESMSADDVASVLRDAAANGETVVATAHRPWELDREVLSSFDRLAFVHPPDWEARRFRLWESPLGRVVDADGLDRYIVATEGWCGEDLSATFGAGVTDPEPVTFGIVGPVTDAWLNAARDWARECETDLGVDDLAAYLARTRRW